MLLQIRCGRRFYRNVPQWKCANALKHFSADEEFIVVASHTEIYCTYGGANFFSTQKSMTDSKLPKQVVDLKWTNPIRD